MDKYLIAGIVLALLAILVSIDQILFYIKLNKLRQQLASILDSVELREGRDVRRECWERGIRLGSVRFYQCMLILNQEGLVESEDSYTRLFFPGGRESE